jgi:DNA mismatch repair protein MSH2
LLFQEAGSIRGKKGYIDLGTQKAGTYFTTPALKEYSSSYAEYTKAYEKTQTSLVKEVVEIAGKRSFFIYR